MYPFLAEISHPIQCFLISEEVPSISIILKERRSNALKGSISSKSNLEGDFYTHRPGKKFLILSISLTVLLNLSIAIWFVMNDMGRFLVK